MRGRSQEAELLGGSPSFVVRAGQPVWVGHSRYLCSFWDWIHIRYWLFFSEAYVFILPLNNYILNTYYEPGIML